MTIRSTRRPSQASTENWDNEGGQVPQAGAPSTDHLEVELKRHGIAPVQLTVFDWGGYRYSSARDAIAAAKRLEKSALA